MRRFCFRQDENCHNYIIPCEMAKLFNTQSQLEWDDPNYQFDELFEEYRCDSVQNWSFTDPREDA